MISGLPASVVSQLDVLGHPFIVPPAIEGLEGKTGQPTSPSSPPPFMRVLLGVAE